MAEQGFKRKLAAILSADVEGYSRLMDDDEEATVRTLTSYRTAIADLVQQFRGRVVDTPGDNILTDFTSVVDAVNCAVEIQRDLAERNAELPDNRKMQFRIGVNLGDVIEEEGRIYGDGVNIAARVESLSEAGGICISGRAHDQVENKLGLEYEDLGKHEVKNISRPIQVYRVLSYPGAAAHRVVQAKETLKRRWRKIGLLAAVVVVIVGVLGIWQFYLRPPAVEPASVEKMAYPLSDKPSIAVLAFDNMSGDPEQGYFSDGLSEEIITALSKSSQIFVIARNSSFTYKGKPVKVQQVAEELGVRYVLEGSVRKDTQQVRITAQLIDAAKGTHLWAERYHRDLKDIFAIQDDITKQIIAALHVKLTIGEDSRIIAKTTNSLEAYLKYLQAREEHFKFTKENNRNSRRLVGEAISIDPEYGMAYSLLGATHMLDVWLQATDSPKKSLGEAIKLQHKAIALGANAHHVLGFLYLTVGQPDKAIAECHQAVELDPNSATARTFYGVVLNRAGRFKEAVHELEQGLRLDPFSSSFTLRSLALAYSNDGRSEDAIEMCKKTIQKAPNDLIARIVCIQAYSTAGRQEEAEKEAAEVLRINPKFYLKSYEKRAAYKNQADTDRMIAALRKAGLPEQSPPPLPDKPSIAVLPFVNMSNDPEQEYFSDGMTDDIITDLSKISGLMVISSSSTFTYKGKAIKIPEIAKELGVKYVLEGSVRRAGDEVRINAQLIDAASDHHVWADRFDGKYEGIFALQDRITERIVSALAVKISPSEQKVMAEKGTSNMVAYDTFLKAMSHMLKFTPKDYVQAIDYFKKAIDLDPNYSDAYANLAYTYNSAYIGGRKFMHEIGKPGRILRLLAHHYAEKAMKQPTSRGYQVMAVLELFKRNFKKAIDNAEHAVSIAPNDADAFYTLGRVMVYTDKPEKGITYYKKSIMLDPLHKSTEGIGFAYFTMGDYENAVKYIEKFFKDYSECAGVRSLLAASYVFLGNDIKAKEEFDNWFT